VRGRYWPVTDLDAVPQRLAECSARPVIFGVEPLDAFWDTDEPTPPTPGNPRSRSRGQRSSAREALGWRALSILGTAD
jgi:hypothetical protein